MATPVTIRLTLRLLDELEDISRIISENTDAAVDALAMFRNKHLPTNQKSVAAKANLLTLVIASARNTFGKQGIDDKKLFTWSIAKRSMKRQGNCYWPRHIL